MTKTTSERDEIVWKEKDQTFLSKQVGNMTNEGVLELLKHPQTSLCGFDIGGRQTEAAERQHPALFFSLLRLTVGMPPPPPQSTLSIQHCWVCLQHLIVSLSGFGVPCFKSTNQL